MTRHPEERPGGAEPAPEEGIYLDARLESIGQQVAERIDQVERRRRVRLRFGVTGLVIAALAGGSVAAAALSRPPGPDAAVHTPAARVAAQLRCVQGDDPRGDAYFSASYRTGDDRSVDASGVCGTAWRTLSSAPEALRSLSPRALALRAAELLDDASTVPGGRATSSGVSVQDAAVGPLDAGTVLPEMPASPLVCRTGSLTVVLSGAHASCAAVRP